MKNIIFLLLLLPILAFGQFPNNANKQRLGFQTTALGLTYYADTIPLHTPSNFRNDAEIVIDTVLDVTWKWTGYSWNAQETVRRTLAPPATITQGGNVLDYRYADWWRGTDSTVYVFNWKNTCWQPKTPYIKATEPTDEAASGSSAAVCYTYQLWHNTANDSLYAHTGGDWLAIGTGGGGGLSDGDYGDIVVGGSGTTMTIDNDAVTSAKILDGTIAAADLAATGVTAATYLNATVTFNAAGQATSASSGPTPITGNGVANRIPYYLGTTALTNDANFTKSPTFITVNLQKFGAFPNSASSVLLGNSNGASTGVNNIAIGGAAGNANTTGESWIAEGTLAGTSNTSGSYWIAQGAEAGRFNVSGSRWIAQGASAGASALGSFWVAQGQGAAIFCATGDLWTVQGYNGARTLVAGGNATSFSNSVYTGANTKVSGNGVSNENVFGYEAEGKGSNTVSLGNSSILGTYTSRLFTRGTTTAARPVGVAGYFGYNTTWGGFDIHNGTAFRRLLSLPDATPTDGHIPIYNSGTWTTSANRPYLADDIGTQENLTGISGGIGLFTDISAGVMAVDLALGEVTETAPDGNFKVLGRNSVSGTTHLADINDMGTICIPVYCQPHDAALTATGTDYRGWVVPNNLAGWKIVRVHYALDTPGSGTVLMQLTDGTLNYAGATIPVGGSVEVSASITLVAGTRFKPVVGTISGTGHEGLMMNLIIQR